MTSALGYGLMGAAQGALSGLHDRWQQTQNQIQTERLMRAKALEEERLRVIAEAKDERDHVQAKELKGLEVEAADKRQQSSIDSADRRARESREAADVRAKESAAARIRAAEITAARPRGSASQAKQQLFVNDAGEQKWIAPGDEIPSGYYRAPASGKPQPSAPARATPPKPADPNAPPVEGAKKAPDGFWYVQQGGKWFKVETD